MTKEYSSLMKNHTWDHVSFPKGQKIVHCKWVYRTKYATDGSIDKNKARLVAKDYSKSFSLVSNMNSICLVLSLVASQC
jgi:hypothetical protein